ncbi:MAG: acyl-CoA thioesterase I [Gammaproteobacteria bacterium]|nr:MAG: acyl-CoA thioesterase I [Gammaproteobacteria bacterium]
MVLGDSLSAGYGIDQNQGWVALLQRRLAKHGYPHDVVNASISGDTTAGGRFRLDNALAEHHPAIVIIELGGNDGLRGLSLADMEANLAKIIEKSRTSGATLLLIGMRIPPNYGRDYTIGFENIYTRLAKKYNVPRVPFLLEGIADNNALMQSDRIHPNGGAQGIVLDNVWPRLEPLLK